MSNYVSTGISGTTDSIDAQASSDDWRTPGLSDLWAPKTSVSAASTAWLKAQTDGSALTGTALNEQLSTGNAANVTLSGGAGDDTYLINATTKIVESVGGGIDTAYTWLASTTLADNVENLTIATGSAADGTGNGLANILTGGAGRNVLTGGGGDDRLIGGAGSDTFVFRPGEGRDTIMDFAAKGADGDLIRLDGYGFADFAALKTAMWQDGANVVIRLSADDSVVLRNVNLSDLSAADFDLTNVPGVVAPTVTAEPVLADALQNVADAMKITGLSDLLAPAVSATGAAKAWLKAQTDGSALTGTALNEQLSTGNAANVTLSGGAGDDAYLINATTKIVESVGGGIDTAYTWLASTTLADNVENLTIATGSAADGIGNGLANILTGGAGRNVLTGGGGDVRLIGGAGSDTFVFKPGDGRDTIMDFAAKGADGDLIRLDGYSFADFAALQPNMWQDGANVVILLDSADSVVLRNVDLSDLTAADFAFTNVVAKPVTVVNAPKPAPVLGATAALKAGGAGDDVLVGTAGRDAFVVSDGAGSDTIKDFQAKGGDILVIRDDEIRSFADFKAAAHQSGADLVVDLADGHSVTLQGVTLGQLSAGNVMADFSLPDSGSARYWASASWAGQSLVGTSGNDQFSSTFDPVTLAGGRGDDVYAIVGQQSTVIEKAGEGVDTIVYWGDGLKLSDAQSIENLTLAGARASWAVGNALDNIIRGNASDNMLNGGAGSDVLTGGAGRDTFVVAAGQGDDVITDFTAGVDTLRLDGFSFKSAADVVGAMTQVGTDVLLKLSAGQSLVLKNVQVSDFDAGDIALPSSTAGMVQTFRDDFNSLSTFDGESGTWRTHYEWGGDAAFTQAKNGEQQIYVDPTFKGLTGKEAAKALGLNPFSIENGHLVITSKPIDPSLSAYTGGYKFSSGLITTEATFAQTYGHFEMRADLPEGHGAWPAFWLLPTDNSSPPELDIMEAFGDRPDMVHHALHSTTAEGAAGGWVSTGDLSGEHTFGATWTPYTVTFYVDGLQTAQYATPTDMNKPMYMLANLAVGGSWAGNAAADAIAQFKIDSITAWQLPEYTLENFKLLTSGATTNSVIGTSKANILVGTGANDMIKGAGGADTLSGGAGDDTYIVADARAVIKEALGAGIDSVQSSVSFSLAANVENLFLKGVADIDAFGNTQSNIITGNAGDNLIRGGGGNDVLTGGAGHDVFAVTTGDGSDIITDFKTGEDAVRIEGYDLFTFKDVTAGLSQHGDDVYLALSSTDTMVFRDHHLADFSAADFQFVSELPVSGAPVRYEIGTTAGERLVGSRSNNAFDGKGGADTLIGGYGDDTYRVYYGAPTTIIEKAGQGVDTAESYISYTLGDNVENLKLLGTSLSGTGNALGNRIDGGSGADTLNGKGGDDRLFGGAGKDVFVYERGSGFDTIVDFHAKGSGSAEPDTLKFVGYGPGATLSHVGDIWTISDPQGHDSFHLTGVTSLSAGDFIFG